VLTRREIGGLIPLLVAVWLVTALLGYAAGGATASIVGAGLSITLLSTLMRSGIPGRRLALPAGVGILLCGVALTVLCNNHGPPVLIGTALGAILLRGKTA
jgi:thiol:disulfide interchange protein